MKSLSRKKKKVFFLWVLILSLVLGCVSGISLPVQAAVSYEGSGTASSPYLVENAAQLDGMRNNLSAHYKLANTIDMSSYGAFEPIGYEGAKFTGSFTCDTNSDGTPKYVIKNLKIYIDAGEKYGHKIGVSNYLDYVEGKNKWQAGLFGYTDGATIQNIAVLNADVTNTVVGQNMGNSDQSVNPGQGAGVQSAGILIGTAYDTTVTGCMSSGTINAKNNATGGLIGYAMGGTLTKSYSTANVTSSGYWYTGGLLGLCSTDVSHCFATGNVQGGPTETNTGGFIGQIDESSTVMIISCYSTGKVSPEAAGFSFIGFRTTYSAWKTDSKTMIQNVMYCYTTGSVAGYSAVQTGDSVVENNNYILGSSMGRQEYFKAASMDEIKTALAACGDYDVSGSTPVLKNVAVISDASKYVPGAVSATASNAEAAGTDKDTEGNASTETTTVTPKEVATMIEALPTADELTIEDKDAVKEAKRAYDALTADQKLELSTENIAKLNDVYNQAVVLILSNLKDSISELPKVNKLTSEDYDGVMELYDDYEFLGEENQSFLKQELREKLLAAVEKVASLKENGDMTMVEAPVSTAEWLLFLVLTVLIVLLLIFNVIWSVWIIRKYRGLSKRKEVLSK